MSRVMKNSGIEWIGEIPEDWRNSKVGKIGEYINGFPFKPESWGDIGLPIIRIQNLTDKNKIFNRFDGLLDKKYLIENGDYLISWSATLDVFIWKSENAYLNQHIFKSIPNEKIVDKQFFYWLAKVFISEMTNNKHGSAMQHVKKSVFDNFSIVLPPIISQKMITNYLDLRCTLIDQTIEKQKDLIEKLKYYKQSVITDAVTKGLDPKVQFIDSGIEWIGEIPQSWTVKKLKYIIETPLQYGANSSGVDYDEMLPRYIRITDITSDNYLKSTGMLSLNEEEAQPFILKDKDLLFARSGGTVGKTFLYRETYGYSAFAGYLIKASISKNYDAEFIYYFTLSSAYNEWKNQIFIQSTIQNIGADKYSNMKIALPSDLKEQKRIANYLDDKCKEIDNTINTNEKIINKLEQYKKSLIYECVTGKREVK